MTRWIVSLTLPGELDKNERLKAAIEEINNRFLNSKTDERKVK